MAITQEQLKNWFTYHPPTPVQLVAYEKIRQKAYEMATVIVENSPSSADQTAAIRLLREAVMTANVSIACDGK